MYIHSILLGALALTTAAIPVQPSADGDITPQMLIDMDSQTATCPEPRGQCADAALAAPAINKSFTKYNITNPKVKAALIATMLLESAGFKYDRNAYPPPGNPGQGTRNMQMPEFNYEYAKDVFGAAKVDAYCKGNGSEVDQTKALDLLLCDTQEFSFGSAAWFYQKHCASVMKALEAPLVAGQPVGEDAGFVAYLGSDCVRAVTSGEVPAERVAPWEKALQVLGVSAMAGSYI